MSINLPKLLKGIATTTVNSSNIASNVVVGALPVFGTPYLIALSEKAAFEVVQKELSPKYTTVGTRLDIQHLAATPIALQVTAEAVLVNQDKRALEFDISVFDSTNEKVGEGKHWRVIVEKEKFMTKVEAKSQNQ
jgi:fluoroacetyl-CoA thioesterase